MSDDTYDEEPELNLYFSNIVTAFCLSTSIDLKLLTKRGMNTFYDSLKRMTRIRLTEPKIFASIWYTGKVVCAGAQDSDEAYCNAKYLAKLIKNLGFDVKMKQYRIVNVSASCKLPYQIDLSSLAFKCPDISYLPERHPGALWHIDEFKATLTIYKTGNVTVFATGMVTAGKAMKKFLRLMKDMDGSGLEIV